MIDHHTQNTSFLLVGWVHTFPAFSCSRRSSQSFEKHFTNEKTQSVSAVSLVKIHVDTILKSA